MLSDNVLNCSILRRELMGNIPSTFKDANLIFPSPQQNVAVENRFSMQKIIVSRFER